MRGHNICFTEEILKIIPKLSLLLLLIWSLAFHPVSLLNCVCGIWTNDHEKKKKVLRPSNTEN